MGPSLEERIPALNARAEGLCAPEILALVAEEFPGRAVFASSLGEEDQVLTDMIAGVAPGMPVFTLDTGRLFPETYDLLAKTMRRYPMPFRVYVPEASAVEAMVAEHGINLFYESVELRRLCCGVRKVAPLRRALEGYSVWICGLRREQAVTRQGLDIFSWDAGNAMIKACPLAGWSLDQVRAYVREHRIDVHPLHARGFVSIGCACCTRAVGPGEDVRAGRWWWESPEHKECGLHARRSTEGGPAREEEGHGIRGSE